ncbi:GapS6b family protein [Gilliamella apicola]|uniref:GapS6b family protein n=1 Tax=Gilliamella apicola TaxID=1196095 RepID=UPI002FEE4071
MNKNEFNHSIQIHKGTGDNISGNKNISIENLNIYQEIASKNIQKNVTQILNDLRDYKIDEAKIKLTTLQSLGCLDEESSAIIETLSIHADLIAKENIDNALSVINRYLTKHKNLLIRDLCLSAFIKLSCHQHNDTAAKERYLYEKHPGEYAKKSYYTFLADADELIEIFNSEKFSLTENELEGIVYGTLRHNKGEFAYQVAQFLDHNFKSYNSEFLILCSRAVKLNPILSNTHYWLCSSELRSELMDICNQLIRSFEVSKNRNFRIFNIATPLIYYLRGDHKDLLSLCRKYINEVEKIDNFVAHCIDQNIVIENVGLSEIDSKKIFEDESYKKEKLEKVLRKKQISSKEASFIGKFASSQQIRNWLEEYGEFSTKDKTESDFNSFYLKTLSVTNNKDLKYINEIRCDFNLLINKYSEIIKELNPEYILEIAEKLIHIGLVYESSHLLNLLIPIQDSFWNSQLIYIYINSLYEGQQYLQLSQFLNKVEKKTWNNDIFIIKAVITSFEGNLVEAVKIIKEALNYNILCLKSWEYLVHLNIMLKTEKIENILNEIPLELFNEPSKVGNNLLILMAKNNLFNKAEKIIVSWFIQDPNNTFIYLSDFNLNLLNYNIELSSDAINKLLFSGTINNCLGGITYKLGNKIITKLIIKNPTLNHEIILDTSSPMAKFLNELSVGERRKHSMGFIEIIEKTTPYITAAKLANTLRVKLNDGSDCFDYFTVPDDPNEMIEFFKEKFTLDKDDQQTEIFKNPFYPMIFKSYFMGKVQDPIQAALSQFTDDKYVKHNLINVGDESAKDIIVDIYTICYLTLTQLSKNIEQAGLNLKITIETKLYLENWIARIESGKYLTAWVDKNGKLTRTTSENIIINYSDMIIEMKHIIKIADIVYPKLIDVNPVLLFFKKFMDIGTYSTILSAISLDIHLLCIDQVLIKYLQSSNIKIYNPINLFAKLGNSLDFQSKKLGLYLHASECIPYVPTLDDLYLLAASQDNSADIWLVKMLNKYSGAIGDNFEEYSKLLATILFTFISNGIRQGKFLLGNPKQNFKINNPFSFGADDVFYACCNNILKYPSDLESEEKIVFFLQCLFTDYKNIKSLFGDYESIKLYFKWLLIAGSSFTLGHFMSFDEINNRLISIFYNLEK